MNKDLIDTILSFPFFKEECPLNFVFEENSKEEYAQNIFYNDDYCENNCNDNYKDCFKVEETSSLLTEYFDDFDYVFGDYSYGKLRLKGFFESNSKKCKKYNNIDFYKKYLEEFCAKECPYFLIKKKITIEKK